MRYTNKTLARAWANQIAPKGKAGAFSFSGPSLYSYGVEIARRVQNADGEVVFLFLDKKYSVTTSIHQGIARDAISRADLPLYVEAMPRHDASPETIWTAVRDCTVKSVQNCLAKAKSARVHADMWLQRHDGELIVLAEAAVFFDQPRPSGELGVMISVAEARVAARAAKR